MTPQELKNSILQLAIQGKLVEQREEEGNAEDLYTQIQAEKQRLIAEKKIKKQKPLPAITDEEKPFEIPESWKWVRLGDIATLYNGRAYKQNELLDSGKYPVLRVGNLFTSKQWYYSNLELEIEKYCTNGDLLYSWSASFGPHIWNGGKVIYHYHIWKVEYSKYINREYLYYLLLADTEQIRKSGHGLAMIHVTKAGMEKRVLPLPPLAEQQRIVAKIEELLPQIDRYEQAWSKLEQFNARFPEDMKKSLLQYAIQGKLVEQRPEEGDAEDLYAQIQAEKQRLIAEKKIKKQKPLPEITDEEKPFDIPKSWKWVRLGEILLKLTDGTHSTPKYTDSGVPFLSVKDVSAGKLNFSNCKYISEQEHEELYSRCNPEYGDLLLTKVGTTGIPVLVDTYIQFSLFVSVALLKFNQQAIYNKYLQVLINSPLVQMQAAENTRGVGNKNWVMRDISNTLIVLPPLAEQKRIVEKLEQLLPLCERLK